MNLELLVFLRVKKRPRRVHRRLMLNGHGTLPGLDFDRVLIIVEMLKLGTPPEQMFRDPVLPVRNDIVDELVHTILTLELVRPYAVHALGVWLDPEHPLLE